MCQRLLGWSPLARILLVSFPIASTDMTLERSLAQAPVECTRRVLSMNLFCRLCCSDVQIVNEVMLEDINNILNAGDVPNLYTQEDMDSIMNTFRRVRTAVPPYPSNGNP